MNQKTFFGLALAALLALLAAIVIQYRKQPQQDVGAHDEFLAPALHEHVNDVSSLVIRGAGDKVLATLVRGDKGWTLAEKAGYAVDSGKLRELLLKLADAKLVEPKTANKDKYALLGVQDLADADAKGLGLEIKGLAQPLQLIIGDSNPHGGTYVRRVGDAQSWLTRAALSVDKDPANWLHKELLSIPASRIASVNLTHAADAAVRLAKKPGSDADFSLLDIPSGREAGDAYAINGVAGTLDGLRFDDVLPGSGANAPDDAHKARFETTDGLLIDVASWPVDGKHRAQFAISLDTAKADEGIEAAQARLKVDYEKALAEASAAGGDKGGKNAAQAPLKPLAVSDAGKDREQRLRTLEDEVATLQARLQGWTFVLPAYKAANLDKSLVDLLKSVEAKAAGTKTKAR